MTSPSASQTVPGAAVPPAPEDRSAATLAAYAGLELRLPDGSTLEVPAPTTDHMLALHRLLLRAKDGDAKSAMALEDTIVRELGLNDRRLTYLELWDIVHAYFAHRRRPKPSPTPTTEATPTPTPATEPGGSTT